MSGSNSSATDGAAEALRLTVHSLPAPGLPDRRTRSGRLKMLLVLAVCVAPVLASYLSYFVIRPGARSNYGTLIQPTHALPADLQLRRLDGVTVSTNALKGQWLLLLTGPAACDDRCEKRLYMQRQLREMLGRERDRVDKVWLVTDGGRPAPALLAAAMAAPAVQVLRADKSAVAGWLAPEAGRSIEDHLYIVDPMGEWMMRMPADADPGRVKRDLERLLRASAGWDKPGH